MSDNHHQRGRRVPEPPADDEPSITIRVNGVVFGVVYPRLLTARAQIDLERATGALGLLRWCATHAGVDHSDATRDPATGLTDLDRLEEELAEMPLQAVMDLIVAIGEALREGVEVPKRSGRR